MFIFTKMCLYKDLKLIIQIDSQHFANRSEMLFRDHKMTELDI